MKKNRKRADTYRFNGHPSFHAHSIHSVTIADLEVRIKDCEAKLADPNDSDDKKWVQWWLARYKQELAKKHKGLALKQRERHERRRTEEGRQECS
jgi:hypothetical protein